mgnify:CR=1 FL=1
MITSSEFKNALISLPQIISEKNKEYRTFKLSVKKRFDGHSLIDLFTESFPHVQRDFWLAKITTGNLLVDGKPSTPNHRLRAGQITQHSVAPKPEPLVNWDIHLMEATESYWVLSKPSPLPVHAGGRYLHNTLTSGLKLAFPDRSFHLINRLDANTTGIVLVALNKQAANFLSKQFENRAVTKTYLALVEGRPKQDTFSSNQGISKTKTPAGGRKLVADSHSKTDFSYIKSFENESLLRVTPHSGHTNQIRLHLAGLGLPIKGDPGYKNPEYFKTHPLTYSVDGLFLHAWKLKFTDPESGTEKEVSAAPNKKWAPYL